MVYCNCEKTNHNKDLACTYYIHYSKNLKKNFQIPEKVKSEDHYLRIPCLQSFFLLPRQRRLIFFAHLKSYLDSPSGKKSITGLWHHLRSHGTGFGSGSGNLSRNQKPTGGYSQLSMTLSTPRQAGKFLDVPMSSIMLLNRISQNIPGHRMSFPSDCLKLSKVAGRVYR